MTTHLCTSCGDIHTNEKLCGFVKLADGTAPGNERSPLADRDAGADRDTREPKPCARRFAPGQWCTRTDVHPDAACGGPPRREFPPTPLEKGRVR